LEQLQLLYKASRINYLRFGTGPKPAFCFHGYGEEANSFSFLEKDAGDQYTFFAIDLPYHGQTHWNEGLIFTIDDLSEIIQLLLSQAMTEQRLTNNDQLSLIGFSLGGRVVLSLYEKMHFQIEKLILLAPDGLKVNFWYWLSTQTWVGNKLFISTMKHPGWFFFLLRILNKLGLVNASVFKFVNHYIGDQQAQQQQVDSSQIVLEMSADRQMSVNKQIVANLGELETRLRAIFEQRQEKTMFIAAAGTLRYGEIVAVIDAAKGAGVEKVGIVTEGMRRAGKDLTTDSLIKGLESIQNYRIGPVATPRTFATNHHIGNLTLVPMTVKGGEWQPVAGWTSKRESDILSRYK
jgi:pimeloyl-ACP methyl ester carboxylesterase